LATPNSCKIAVANCRLLIDWAVSVLMGSGLTGSIATAGCRWAIAKTKQNPAAARAIDCQMLTTDGLEAGEG
jgi:hypothetical protein